MTKLEKAAARGGALVIGLLLIFAAIAEFAIAPLELLMGSEIQHAHKPAWLSAVFLFVGVLLSFPTVAARLYKWARPHIPTISIKRGSG